ncbi:MAG: prepilin peptidase [Arcobacter sp.]|nr:MAG: prepilin peptidase [Arcobacter sp.]
MGSFLNVLIYRVPLGISLFNPKRSQCTHCNSTIEWYENIPIISYILLKGRCSKCKEKISIFYPLVEVITAMVTLSLYKKIGLTSEFIFVLIIFYLLIVLSFIDFRYKAVPDSLLVLVTSITLLYLIVNKPEHLSTFFIFAGGIIILELFISYYIQNIKATLTKDDSLRDQKALGEGDVPIVAIIGGVLGLQFGLIAIFLSAILAIIPSLISRLYKKDIETPFVPYLSLGFFITYIGTQSILKILEGLNIV